MTNPLSYESPETLDTALDVLAGGGATILAGGTDLMVQAEAGRVSFEKTLLNIRRVKDLAGISEDDGEIRIGALTTITEILESALLAEKAPILVEAADKFASAQIRNAGTIGGNICNASPAGDTLPPLMALDAEVELAAKPNGSIATRRLPLADFVTGPGRTARAPGELLTAVIFPAPASETFMRFYKHGTRPALDISTISIALAGRRGPDGAIAEIRLVLGAVAATPIRARDAETALKGRPLTAEAIEAAAQAAEATATPIDDVRASAWYRTELVRNMTKRMLEDVADP